jgi:fermentation-respiration switch protein FrsA (DUF1100 family)
MIGLALSIIASLVLVWTFQRKLIYFPFGQVPPPRAISLSGATPVTFSTADHLNLTGWFVSPRAAPRFAVIVFNGNAGNRAFRAPLANALVRQGIAVLLFDYRGFGGNPGSPTELGLRADSRAALKYVLSRPDVDPKRIVYLGESLGAAVATELASEFPPAALILRSPFTSMVDVGRAHYPFLPVSLLLRDRYATIDLIGSVRTRLLIIAGDQDRIVPVEQSRRLHEAAHEPKALLVIPNADHNDDELLAGRQMIDAIVRFL